MDQHEKDWLRLGQDLHNYQPQGDPVGDFARFQELQRETSGKARPARLGWLLLGLLLMMASAIWLFQDSTPSAISTAFPMPIAQRESAEAVSAQPSVSFKEIASSNTLSNIATNTPAQLITAGAGLLAPDKANPIADVEQVDPELPSRAAAEAPLTTLKSESLPESQLAITAMTSAQAEPVRNATVYPVARLSGAQEFVLAETTLPYVSLAVAAEESVISPSKTVPKLSFGGGLSSHWRGDQFLSDTDLGVYVSLGIQKPIGERFSIAGRVGYRGHNLNLQVLEEEKPWSHYEEKINEIDDNGEEIEYTYVGVVDGYKGIEFSVLLQYELNHRTTLQAGGRYSLPSLAFRRTVHSSRDGDVTAQPNPYHFFATQQPLVKYYDYGALFGGQYRINNSLSFEAQLHLGMVDLIEDAGERMERFNHSSSVSLGLRYRLN